MLRVGSQRKTKQFVDYVADSDVDCYFYIDKPNSELDAGEVAGHLEQYEVFEGQNQIEIDTDGFGVMFYYHDMTETTSEAHARSDSSKA